MPKIKSKFKIEARQKEQLMIKKLYLTGEYSIRDLMAVFKRSQQFIYKALNLSTEKSWQKILKIIHYKYQNKVCSLTPLDHLGGE